MLRWHKRGAGCNICWWCGKGLGGTFARSGQPHSPPVPKTSSGSRWAPEVAFGFGRAWKALLERLQAATWKTSPHGGPWKWLELSPRDPLQALSDASCPGHKADVEYEWLPAAWIQRPRPVCDKQGRNGHTRSRSRRLERRVQLLVVRQGALKPGINGRPLCTSGIPRAIRQNSVPPTWSESLTTR